MSLVSLQMNIIHAAYEKSIVANHPFKGKLLIEQIAYADKNCGKVICFEEILKIFHLKIIHVMEVSAYFRGFV